MPIFITMVLLVLAFYGSAFGITRLLLRNTAWEGYGLEAPWLTGPALVVLAFSCGGYLIPSEILVWHAWAFFGLSWLLTLIVVVWDRHALVDLFRQHWSRCLAVSVPAWTAVAITLSFLPNNPWDQVAIPGAGEYLLYATLATPLTGHHQGVSGTEVFPFCGVHRSIRFGQDLIVAVTAQVTGRHPMQVVMPLAVLFRFQQTVMIGLVLCAMAKSRFSYGWVGLVLMLDAVLRVETVLWTTSFFSSNCTTPLYAIYLVWLACQPRFGWRECAMCVLMNLFFLVTYPEFLPVLKTFEVLAIVLALWRRQPSVCAGLVVANIVVLAMHPVMVVDKATLLATHLSRNVGWNLLGNPVDAPGQYLANVLGLDYAPLSADFLEREPWLNGALLAAVLLQLALGLWLLARRYRVGVVVLAWMGLFLAIHGRSMMEGLNYYPALKFISHTYFVVILAAGALVVPSPCPLPVLGRGYLRYWQRMVGVSLFTIWLSAAAWTTWAAAPQPRKSEEDLSFCRLKDVVAACADGGPVVVLTTRLEPFLLMNMVSGATGVPLVALTTDQELSIPLWGLCWRSGLGDANSPSNCRRGLALVDPEVLDNDGYQLGHKTGSRVECQRVLGHVGRMLLCEAIVHTPAGLTFHGGYWIGPQSKKLEPFVATGPRLTFTGTVVEFLPFPYRCKCRVVGTDWQQEIVVERTGFFETTLELPPELVNTPVALEFVDIPTFRPCDVPGGSSDTNEYGFTLLSVKVQTP